MTINTFKTLRRLLLSGALASLLAACGGDRNAGSHYSAANPTVTATDASSGEPIALEVIDVVGARVTVIDPGERLVLAEP